ncbi:hypothetical protein KIPB_010705, partial [Kipferlia bialata]|eukprot:g10705.t1
MGGRCLVDGYALLYTLAIRNVDWSYGGENQALKTVVDSFCAACKEAGCSLMVVLPGAIDRDAETFEQTLKRESLRTPLLDTLTAEIGKFPFRHVANSKTKSQLVISPLTWTVFTSALSSNGVRTKLIKGDPRPYMLTTAKESKSHIIGYDPLYLAADIPSYVHVDSIGYGAASPTCLVARPVSFTEATRLSTSRMQMLALISSLPLSLSPPPSL